MAYILLFEDDPANAVYMTHLLEGEGYTVRHVVRGLDGLRALERERPALILMDFNLPDADGRALTLVIRRQLGPKDAPPIIAVTGETGHYEETIAARVGCAAFLAKPFEPDQLLDLVARFMPLSDREVPVRSSPTQHER